MEEQVTLFDLGLWSGKMSPEPSVQTEETTSKRSSKKSSASQSRRLPTFHYLQRGSGLWQTPTMEMGGLLPTEFSMHSFGECPRDAVESRLSQILEAMPHPKYSLSAKACKGILTRANRRGKKLPELLEIALVLQSLSECEQDVRGGGKGALVQVEKSGTLGCNNDQAIFCIEPKAYRIGAFYSKGMLSSNPEAGIVPTDKACTLDCNGGSPTSQQGGVCIVQPVICMATGQSGAEITENIAPTLNCNHEQPIILTVGDVANTLRGRGQLSHRGDQDNIVLQLYENHGQDSRLTGPLEIAPTVAQKFGTGGNNTPLVLYIGSFSVDCRNGTMNPDINGTLQAKPGGGTSLNLNNVVLTTTGDGAVLLDGKPCIIISLCVRRLTPMECERLQGYPDGWTDIGEWTDSNGKSHKESSDSSRYKALGNSIALPPWTWVLKRICACYERPAMMASLFDGIGGFPLIWERLNGPGTCLWASEIEEFPMAVTKVRFADRRASQWQLF